MATRSPTATASLDVSLTRPLGVALWAIPGIQALYLVLYLNFFAGSRFLEQLAVVLLVFQYASYCVLFLTLICIGRLIECLRQAAATAEARPAPQPAEIPDPPASPAPDSRPIPR